MKNVVIQENDVGRRIDNFVMIYLKKLPRSLIYKLLRKRKIKVNNKKVCENYRLNCGDIVNLFLNDELLENETCKDDFLNVSSEIDIIYEDENLLLVNKKVGLVCHPDCENLTDCLINRVKKYLFCKNEYDFENENTFSPALVNRIDRNTEGIVIVAKNYESLKILNEKMKKKEIKKFYKCAVIGEMPKNEDLLVSFLYKDTKSNKVYISNKKDKNFRMIQTKYKVLEFKNNISYLEIELLTGRSHQIRAHLAHIGHPIIGDGKYGTSQNEYNVRSQLLVSYKIKFEFKETSSILDYINHKEFQIKNSHVVNKIKKITNKQTN